MTELLNPLTLPLRGSRLIEASAGTGKTWTIAALYVRLVLGHGDADTQPPRPLLPGEILVMTFTIAATRELSDRIRQRLVQAAACFRGDAQPEPHDDFLTRLLQDYPEGPERLNAAWRLAMAAEAMDDASVYTIDAWCQRMLREHAFDSGCLFDEELQANQAALLTQAVHDYWRQQVYPLSGPALELVMQQWKSVDALVDDMNKLAEAPLPDAGPEQSLGELVAEVIDPLPALKQGWVERSDRMLAWLEAQWAAAKSPINKNLLRPDSGRKWLQRLRQWAGDAALVHPELEKKEADRLCLAGMQGAIKSGFKVDIPQPFADFTQLVPLLRELPEPGPRLRLHAAIHVRQRLQQAKAQAGLYGFADMLQRLNDGLDVSQRGDRAQRLRQRIVQQYPVALVDEFQDTSPVQLSIFDRLYRIAEHDPGTALLLIGDPKQSIYGFRGADIHSYLVARRQTEGRHHVLGTNHRSTQQLVRAVNHVFDRAEQRDGDGAFLFGRAAPGEPSALPFVPVAAQGRGERLVCAQGGVPALTLVVDAELRSMGDSRERYAQWTAEQIVTLLNDEQAGFVAFAQPGQPWRRLRPGDIAVLVRTGIDAQAVTQALRQRGMASVYLSDKDTVFQTPEAQDLLRLLQAVASPRDMRLARAALATSLLGLSLPELLQLATHDETFDAQCELLRQLQQTWQTQGVLAMVRRALHGFGLPARWLAGDETGTAQLAQPGVGERRLTNLLHLAELLQAASGTVEGEQALIRWLSLQITDAHAGRGGGDEQVLRLESDADLVQVVTVHKSKGLQYPLVFLPFAAHFRPERGGPNTTVVMSDGQGGRQLFLSLTDEQKSAADLERQREDLRLLYVALTRAQHALWVGAAAVRSGAFGPCAWHRSALGYVVSGADARGADQLLPDLQAMAAPCDDIDVIALPGYGPDELTVTRLLPCGTLPPLAPPPQYDGRFDRSWSIGSYTNLVRDAAHAPAADAGDLQPLAQEDEPAEDNPTTPGEAGPRRPADSPWHRFPRGAYAGNFLHDQLEWLAGEGFALDHDTALQQALQRRCERQGWGHRAHDVLEWLRSVCSIELPVPGAALAGLDRATPELEFWLPSAGLRATSVDRLCSQYVLPGRNRPLLPERTLHGMLMGFADLVFEHGGRYWVLDYKSNALGAHDADYTPAAMEAAMLSHRYDVQAVLYLLALHRLLQSRLGAAYNPAQHLGGAVYFFLRGVGSASRGCCHVPPPLAALAALDKMLGTAVVTTP